MRPGDSSGSEPQDLVVLEAATYWDAATGPFSSVTGGFIVVKSRISAATTSNSYTIDSESGGIEFLRLSGRLDAVEPEIMTLPHHQRPDIYLLECRTSGNEYGGEYYGEIEFSGSCFGLILLRSGFDDGQSFRRVGWFTFYSESSDAFWGNWNRIWGGKERSKIRIV